MQALSQLSYGPAVYPLECRIASESPTVKPGILRAAGDSCNRRRPNARPAALGLRTVLAAAVRLRTQAGRCQLCTLHLDSPRSSARCAAKRCVDAARPSPEATQPTAQPHVFQQVAKAAVR